MDAFDSSGLNQNQLGGGIPVNLTGFTPSVTAAITWGGNVVLTDASTFPSGDSFGKINCSINDQSGGFALGAITAADGTVTISMAALKQTDPLTIKVTVTSTLGCIADGEITVAANSSAGTVGNYSVSFTTTTV